MKLCSNCVRDVLLVLEDKPFGIRYPFPALCEQLPSYSEEELYYTCLKLLEGNYIKISDAGFTKQNLIRISTIDDLTFTGHQFLENIRDQSVWSKTLDVAKSVGSFSLKALYDIAAEIIKAKITGLF